MLWERFVIANGLNPAHSIYMLWERFVIANGLGRLQSQFAITNRSYKCKKRFPNPQSVNREGQIFALVTLLWTDLQASGLSRAVPGHSVLTSQYQDFLMTALTAIDPVPW